MHGRVTFPDIRRQGHTLRHIDDDTHGVSSTPAARAWSQALARYRDPNRTRSILEIVVTALPLVALWVLMWWTLDIGYWWLSLPLAIPAGGFLVRLFMIQHDCGHGSFFRERAANDWVGRVLGVFTFTPYDFWQRTHAMHHAGSGNLDRRGFGDIDTLTVSEYLALSRWGKLRYRIYRHPAVMFGIGPAYLFVLRHRLPIGLMRGGWRPWVSTMATNAGIALIVAVLIWFIGLKALLLIHVPVLLIAASIGVWLFYVQHQFEGTTWSHDGEWNMHEAALHGSSYYALPLPLRWITANIGVHHVHHLSSKIPYYRLQRVMNEHPQLREISRLTMLQSLKSVPLVLWDENRRRLISFREMRRARAEATFPAQ